MTSFQEDDLELEEQDRQVDQPLDSSFGDLSLEEQVPKVPSQEYDVKVGKELMIFCTQFS